MHPSHAKATKGRYEHLASTHSTTTIDPEESDPGGRITVTIRVTAKGTIRDERTYIDQPVHSMEEAAKIVWYYVNRPRPSFPWAARAFNYLTHFLDDAEMKLRDMHREIHDALSLHVRSGTVSRTLDVRVGSTTKSTGIQLIISWHYQSDLD